MKMAALGRHFSSDRECGSAQSAAFRGRLIGHLGMELAVGTGVTRFMATKGKFLRKRIANWPLAGTLGQFDQLDALRFWCHQGWHEFKDGR